MSMAVRAPQEHQQVIFPSPSIRRPKRYHTAPHLLEVAVTRPRCLHDHLGELHGRESRREPRRRREHVDDGLDEAQNVLQHRVEIVLELSLVDNGETRR